MIRAAALRSALSCLPLGLALALATPACQPKADQSQSAASATSGQSVGPTRVEAGKTGFGMLPEDALPQFQLVGALDRITEERITVADMPFSQAIRTTVTKTGDDPWTMQLMAKNQTAIEAGDVMLASFWVRCERSAQESGEGRTEFVLELGRDPWTKSAEQPVRVGREWQEIHVPFTANLSFAPGEASIIFRMGYEPQTLEIGGVRLHNFGKQLTAADLPKTKVSYRGREADAAWRKDAAARIDKHRKADLTVIVKDGQGKPIEGAKLHVKQTAHSFWFGTAIAAQAVVNEENNQRYVEEIPKLFNSVVTENNLKWKPLEGDWGANWTFEDASNAIDWARGKGLRTRGHVLVWPSWKHLPQRLEALQGDKAKLKKEVEDHVRELATKMKGRLDHWDVVNEPYDNHDLMDLFGDEVMVDWFKIAHEADPNAKLYLNDYSILSGGGGESGHRAHFEKTAKFLIDNGAPIDGLGMQGHFGSALTAPDDLKKLLDRYAKLGKPIIVTEYDITADDPDLAADYTRDFYTLLFSHPAVEGILMWGFWDGRHWKQNATVFDREWNLKKSGEAYKKLVFGEWMTKADATSDKDGRISVRGFLGEYNVAGMSGDKGAQVPVTLPKDGATVELVIK